MIRIVLNGETREIEAQDLQSLLGDLGLPLRKIAVERNREIVPKSAFDTTELCDGDNIEIVQFVGGG